jgi:hypothetical protein
MLHIHVNVHVHVIEMQDCLASGQSGTGMKKTNNARTGLKPD